jgi:mannose-6-phosphate isomerase-like protein (cupin superfamily)
MCGGWRASMTWRSPAIQRRSHSSKTPLDDLVTVNIVDDDNRNGARAPIVLAPGEGRSYSMGRIRAVFKADGSETDAAYSISEWWLESNTKGPGAHSHPEDDVFYVIEGTMTILVGDRWVEAPQGSFVLVPGGVIHDFENRSAARAGALNLSYPGAFEQQMPAIVEWFTDRPPQDSVA